MSTFIGEGEYRYRVEHHWAELPDGLILGDVAGVGVDSTGRVYAFHRGPRPVLVFEPDGRFVTSWGTGSSRTRTACTSPPTTRSSSPTTATTPSASAPRTARCCLSWARRESRPAS